MFKKIGIILENFFKSAKTMEKVELLLFPGIITMVMYLFFNNNIVNLSEFTLNFNDTVVNITSLLSAFGLASLSIIVTSSSENINLAKHNITSRKDRGKRTVTYYKLLVFRNFYSLFLQLVLLVISIINKFILAVNNNKIILYIEFYLLLCTIFAQIFVVNSIYFLIVNIEKESINDKTLK